jgi:hypothetical protein
MDSQKLVSPPNHQKLGRAVTNVTNLIVFPIPFPGHEPEEIIPEQFFVNHFRTTKNTSQENSLKRRPDIPGLDHDDGRQVPDRNVSGRYLSIRLGFMPYSDHIRRPLPV